MSAQCLDSDVLTVSDLILLSLGGGSALALTCPHSLSHTYFKFLLNIYLFLSSEGFVVVLHDCSYRCLGLLKVSSTWFVFYPNDHLFPKRMRLNNLNFVFIYC